MKFTLALLLSVLALTRTANAHNGAHPSVHDTVAGVLFRLRSEKSPDELVRLDTSELLNELTAVEKAVLASEHIRFTVNQPVRVSVVTAEAPFWLAARGFLRTETTFRAGERRSTLSLWSKDLGPGEIGLGVNSIGRSGSHYAIALEPSDRTRPLEVSELYPGQLRVAEWTDGVSLYADREIPATEIPSELQGQVLIQTLYGRRNDAAITGTFRVTEYPARDFPDQVVLTWSGDPKSTQTVQWRTSTNLVRGLVRYRKKEPLAASEPVQSATTTATLEALEDPTLANDPVCHRFTAELHGLEPDTTYLYSVGDGTSGRWTEWTEFRTAPEQVIPFSFVYMGDAQNGLDQWGALVHRAFRRRPDAAFYVMAGDLVNRGNDRDDWDSFFFNAAGIFDRRPLVPAIGNHENQGGHPTLYLKQFALPRESDTPIEAERCYAFEFSNALFVILDSNLDPAGQSDWLDRTLGKSEATWKFVVYHHPAYSSAPRRDNPSVREQWLPIFDKHRVDLALQGHDHAYLRTYPMRGNRRVDSPSEGTIYIVSVSGTKMYDQDPRDYTERGFTQISTYQVLDIQLDGDRLLYRAYDLQGQIRDQFEIIRSRESARP